MNKAQLDQYRIAAEKIQWQDEPCFYYYNETGKFCLDGKKWLGHAKIEPQRNESFVAHPFVPLSTLFNTNETEEATTTENHARNDLAYQNIEAGVMKVLEGLRVAFGLDKLKI